MQTKDLNPANLAAALKFPPSSTSGFDLMPQRTLHKRGADGSLVSKTKCVSLL